MRYIFTVFVLAFTLVTNAQSTKKPTAKPQATRPTKEETKEWISSKINSYGCSVSDRYLFIVKEGGVLVIADKFLGDYYVAEMLLKDIRTINMQEQGECYWITLTSVTASIKSGFLENGGITDPTYKNKTEIIMSKSFMDQDLPNRMMKALTDLVNAYGGKILKEVY